MNKKVGEILVPVPVKALVQLKTMSAFHDYKTMNFEKIWDDIDDRCEETKEGLSGFVNMMGIVHSIFEVEKSEGLKEAQKIADETMAEMSGEHGDEVMALIAKELRELSVEYKEENGK